VVWNGTWLSKLRFDDVIRLGARSTVARMLERDDFATRYRDGAPIGIHELLYPLMQAHDSVVIRADVELGGTDQTFNILLGRHLQKEAGQPPQVAVILPLLEGTDGTLKMSKSLGNYIGVAEPPAEIFGKLMSISDGLMLRYYALLTDEDVAGLEASMASGRAHPMDVKKRLAEILVARFHDGAVAAAVRAAFEQRFQQRQLDAGGLDEVTATAQDGRVRLPALLHEAGLAKSNSEARRLLKQRAVRVDGATVEVEELPCAAGAMLVIEVGKRRAIRVRVAG
jgi:tyrosyl-tRNA synthetase